MLTWIKKRIAAPVFENNEDKTLTAKLVNSILWTLFVVSVVVPPILAFITPYGATATQLAGAVTAISTLGMFYLLRRGHVRAVGTLLSSLLLVVTTIAIYTFGGIRNTAVTGYFMVIIFAGLLLGGRSALVFGLLSMLAAFAVFYAELTGALTFPIRASAGVNDWIVLITVFSLMALLLRFALRSIDAGLGRARRSAQALAESNRELAASRDALQAQTKKLERRSIQLQAAAEIARDTTATRELDPLLNRAVNLIRDRFGFYHAGIFLVDEAGEYAVLRAATGEAGRQMLRRGHRLRVGHVGIVGYVTGHGKPRIALDVGADAVHFENPLLPETRSEMALPLRIGERIIGALDVQSQQAAAFDEDDVATLQTMADQLAVAIENAHLLNEMQQTVRELQMASGRYTEESWRAAIRSYGRPRGYRYQKLGIEPVTQQSPQADQAWQQGRPVVTTIQPEAQQAAPDVTTSVAMPVRLRGQVLGVLDLRIEEESASPEMVSLVEEIADRLALALENARLLEETQQRAEQERIIGRITAQVRSSMDPETILRTAVRELGRALGSDRAFVRLGDHGTRTDNDGDSRSDVLSDHGPRE